MSGKTFLDDIKGCATAVDGAVQWDDLALRRILERMSIAVQMQSMEIPGMAAMINANKQSPRFEHLTKPVATEEFMHAIREIHIERSEPLPSGRYQFRRISTETGVGTDGIQTRFKFADPRRYDDLKTPIFGSDGQPIVFIISGVADGVMPEGDYWTIDANWETGFIGGDLCREDRIG